MPAEREAHFRHSALRESILEHALIADLLRHFWQRGVYDVEILRSEFDAGGYDLVVSRGDITRHVQLKAMRRAGKTREVTVSARLAARDAGCVLVLVIDDDLGVEEFLWFGAGAHAPLPDISGLRPARHTKGDATGTKSERPNHVRLPLSRCERLMTIEAVAGRLLSPPTSPGQRQASPPGNR